MWADNYWLFCDNKERLVSMVNDVIEDLDMELKSKSQWWINIYCDEDMMALRVGTRGSAWTCLSVKYSRSWDTATIGKERDSKVQTDSCVRAWGAG